MPYNRSSVTWGTVYKYSYVNRFRRTRGRQHSDKLINVSKPWERISQQNMINMTNKEQITFFTKEKEMNQGGKNYKKEHLPVRVNYLILSFTFTLVLCHSFVISIQKKTVLKRYLHRSITSKKFCIFAFFTRTSPIWSK